MIAKKEKTVLLEYISVKISIFPEIFLNADGSNETLEAASRYSLTNTYWYLLSFFL